MKDQEWTEEMENKYQQKLAAYRSSLPPMEKFDPETWNERKKIGQKFFDELTPIEKLRHSVQREAIIL